MCPRLLTSTLGIAGARKEGGIQMTVPYTLSGPTCTTGARFTMKERSNEQWLAALRGPRKGEALTDLRVVLVQGLKGALPRGTGVEASVEDFAQEALIKILGNLDSFRGESRFTVWAQKICVRTAFAEMRRSRWRDISL